MGEDLAKTVSPPGLPRVGEIVAGKFRIERMLGEGGMAHVVEATHLLGFTMSRCLVGHERDLVLVRAHWAARVTAEPWQPVHEILERKEVAEAKVMSALTIEPGLEPLYEEIWRRARSVVDIAT